MQLRILGLQGATSVHLVRDALANKTAVEAASLLVTTKLTQEEKIHILMLHGLSEVQAEAALATASKVAADTAAVGSTSLLTAATASLQTALKGLWTTMKAHPFMAIISAASIAIGLISKLASKEEEPAAETENRIKELNDRINESVSNIENLSSGFIQLKSSADSVITRFAELSEGVNSLGKNVSLTDKEYEEYLNLNNQIAEMFPQLNMGMDSNGNAMLALSGTADTLTSSLLDLVYAERELANYEIAKEIPGLIDNLSELHSNYALNQTSFTIQKKSLDADGNEYLTQIMYVDSDGNLVLNGTIRINSTSNNYVSTLDDLTDTSRFSQEIKETIDEELYRQPDESVEGDTGGVYSTINLKYQEVHDYTDAMLNEYKASIGQYMQFDENGLTLGATSSNFKTVIDNECLAFKDGDATVAYISNSQLYITDSIIRNSLILGNFFFSPREDGGVSLTWQEV